MACFIFFIDKKVFELYIVLGKKTSVSGGNRFRNCSKDVCQVLKYEAFYSNNLLKEIGLIMTFDDYYIIQSTAEAQNRQIY